MDVTAIKRASEFHLLDTKLDQNIYTVKTIKAYIKRTESWRKESGETILFITFIAPHKNYDIINRDF